MKAFLNISAGVLVIQLLMFAAEKVAADGLNDVLKYSLMFYEAQRSGKLPADNRIKWRGDSALNDGKDVGKDLTGGWYDAGDLVKFNFPMSATTTVLTWSLLLFEDAYKSAQQLDYIYSCIKWPLDYFIKCHTGKNELYGQCGNGDEDHKHWYRAEDMTESRPSYKITQDKPGSDLAGETAAAMAAGYMAFKTKDAKYAQTLLQHAEDLYVFAKTYQGKYSDSMPQAKNFYGSSSFYDELVWSAVWLYKATNKSSYLEDAKTGYAKIDNPNWGFGWDDKSLGAMLLLYEVTKDSKYTKYVVQNLQDFSDGKNGIVITPGGLSWRDQWGSLRYAGNAAFIAMAFGKIDSTQTKFAAFAKKQIDYILGSNPAKRSYVVGYGNNYPTHCHHSGSSCPTTGPCGWNKYNDPGPNPNILYGALVGGPGKDDSYQDKRDDYVKNEVACDYNSGFTGAVAGLIEKSLRKHGQ